MAFASPIHSTRVSISGAAPPPVCLKSPVLDERRSGPSGTLHVRHDPSSATGVSRRVFIHTPAAYDLEPTRQFPVLYLRHGNGDLESTWSELGRAGVILDNLVAEGRALPMLIVMPNG